MEQLFTDLQETEKLKKTLGDAGYTARREALLKGAKKRIDESEEFDLTKSLEGLKKVSDKKLITRDPKDGSADEFLDLLTAVVAREKKRIEEVDEMRLPDELKKIEGLNKKGYFGKTNSAEDLKNALVAQDLRIKSGDMDAKREERLKKEKEEAEKKKEEEKKTEKPIEEIVGGKKPEKKRMLGRFGPWLVGGLVVLLAIHALNNANSGSKVKQQTNTPKTEAVSKPSTPAPTKVVKEKKPSPTLKAALEENESWRADFNESIKGLPEQIQQQLKTGITYVNVFAEWQRARVEGDQVSQRIAEEKMVELENIMGGGKDKSEEAKRNNINNTPAYWAPYKYRELAMPHLDQYGEMTGEVLIYEVSPKERLETFSKLFNMRTEALNNALELQKRNAAVK